jgi:hypothetical protein
MQTDDLEDYADEFEPVEEETDDSLDTPIIREDKIFNNRYNTGDGLTEVDDYEFSRKISVSSDYSESYLKDLYEYEDGLENKVILDEIFKFVYSDEELSGIINSQDAPQVKLKLSKEQVNLIFNKINDVFEKRTYESAFYNPIYILEVISSISSIEYKKLFDMLDSELQEILVLELNKKYLFLEGRMQKKRIH